MKLKNINGLIEYNGDFYTAEELQEHLSVSGNFEVVVNDAEDNWFGQAMLTLRDKSEDQ
jgi:hypothetical protein